MKRSKIKERLDKNNEITSNKNIFKWRYQLKSYEVKETYQLTSIWRIMNYKIVKTYKEAKIISKKMMMEKIKNNNVIIYDYIKIDYNSYERMKQQKIRFSGISLPIINLDIRLSSNLFIIPELFMNL